MTPDEFFQLPAAIAVRVLFDAMGNDARDAIRQAPAMKAPLPPKFDLQIFRSGGVQWASETDLEGLRFWFNKANEPPSDPKWAEANRKRAESLARWIAWREWFPDTTWSGERNNKAGVARGPTAKPKVEPRANRPPRPAQEDDVNLDSDIPY